MNEWMDGWLSLLSLSIVVLFPFVGSLTGVKHFSHPFVVNLIIIGPIVVGYGIQLSFCDSGFRNQRVVKNTLELLFRNESLTGFITAAKHVCDFQTEAKISCSQPFQNGWDARFRSINPFSARLCTLIQRK